MEVLDKVPPLIDVVINFRRWCSVDLLRDNDLGFALVQFGDDPVRVERFVCDQTVELNALDKLCNADGAVEQPAFGPDTRRNREGLDV